MLIKITSKRQVTFPARVLDAMSVGPGDRLELQEGPDGYLLRPRRMDYTRLSTRGSRYQTGTRRSTSGLSGRSPMTQPYGIDTSVLAQLATAVPVPDFERCVNELRVMIEEQGFLSRRGRIGVYGSGSGKTIAAESP